MINIFVLTMDEYVHVKEVTHSDKPTDNCYVITVAFTVLVQIPLSLASFPDPLSCFQLKMLNAEPKK